MCQCNPKSINDLDQSHNFDVNLENLKYGLLSFHAWITFLECTLHITY